MRTTLWSRASELFARAVDLDPLARSALLDAECRDAPELNRAVLGLLAAHDRLDPDADLPPLPGCDEALTEWLDEPLGPGTQAGPFTIMWELGTGGMGAVYLARREIDHATQVVALKVASRRHLAPAVQQQLRHERQVLAALEHPNIAHLIDAGELPDGRPYFAMEFVDGDPITRYCDASRLSLRERLRLMLDVMAAVEHAHRRLVLHRDIKAGNILVDGSGRAKLLDFGIAKLLPTDTRPPIEATAEGSRFFSPASAAPEQVQGIATTVATDIYALGVLLYEMLAGCPPLDMRSHAPTEIVRAIVETIPPLASRSVAAMATKQPDLAREVADARRLGEPGALRRQLSGDLDLILARALRKEPEHRYGNVERFAADLRAVLESRPIAARRGEVAYRLGKFARRNTAKLLLGALAALFAIAFVVGMVLQSLEVARARDHAEARREQAEQVTAFLIDLFRAADPNVAQGRDRTAQELLVEGAARLQRLELDTSTRAALATAIADVHLARDDLKQAEVQVGEVLGWLEHLPDAPPMALSRSYFQRARVAFARGNYASADADLVRALTQASVSPENEVDRLPMLQLRAQSWQALGRRAESLALWQALGQEHLRRFGAEDPRTREIRLRLALALLSAGKDADAEALLEANLRIVDNLGQSRDPADAEVAHHLAVYRRDHGRADEAWALAKDVLRINLAAFGTRHSRTAGSHTLLGTIAQTRGDYPAARTHFEQALQVKQAVLGPDHGNTALSAFNLGLLIHYYQQDAQAAEPYLRAAVENAAGTENAGGVKLAIYRLGLGAALRDLGRDDEARTLLTAARKQLEQEPGQPGHLALAEGELACLTSGLSASGQAQILEHVRHEYPDSHPRRKRLEACLRAPTQ